MRAVAVVPLEEEFELATHQKCAEGHEDPSSACALERQEQSIKNCDATWLPNATNASSGCAHGHVQLGLLIV